MAAIPLCRDCSCPTGKGPASRRCDPCRKAADRERMRVRRGIRGRICVDCGVACEGFGTKRCPPCRRNITHERSRVCAAAWRAKNPERSRASAKAQTYKRRSRLREMPKDFTAQSVRGLFEYFGGRCAYCLGMATTIDHIEPLALGGQNALENLVPACRSCNSSKGAKPLLIWLLTSQRAQRAVRGDFAWLPAQ